MRGVVGEEEEVEREKWGMNSDQRQLFEVQYPMFVLVTPKDSVNISALFKPHYFKIKRVQSPLNLCKNCSIEPQLNCPFFTILHGLRTSQ